MTVAPHDFTKAAGHHHQHCQQRVLTIAAQLCQQRQVRLTPLRRQVLELICRSHRPLGAYDLLEQLQTLQGRRTAPPTVYRALEFLLAQGFIHRLASLNAFIGCFRPERHHVGQFFICEQCGNVAEFDSADLKHSLQQSADAAQFTIKQHTIELFGCCQQCQPESV